jgi:membrane associated rhomboid family serine protease
MRLSGESNNYHEMEPVSRLRPAIRLLLLINVAVFLFDQTIGLGEFVALVPQNLFSDLAFYQLFTYGFVHGDLMHLLFNMFALWIFGSELERIWGNRTLLMYYMSCLLGAGIFHSFIDPLFSSDPVGVIGASGGVYGLVAGYGLIFAKRNVYLLGLFRMKALHLAGLFALLSIFSGLFQSADGVAHFAHLGGMITGSLLIYWKPIRHRIRMFIYKQSMSKHVQTKKKTKPDKEDIYTRVDELLDKISSKGINSLTNDERKFLDNASRFMREEKEN